MVKNKQKPKLCECGCGDYAKPGNRFILGHNGRVITDKTRNKISNSLLKYYNNNPEVKLEMTKRTSELWQDSAMREKIITAQLEGWKTSIAHENASKAAKKRSKDSPQGLSEIGTYPELEGVDDKATFDQFGYYSTQLSEKSGRLIVRVCIKCGRTKNITKGAYSSICHRCVTQSEEFCKMRSEIATRQFSTEEGREKDRQGAIKRWLDPEEHIKASIANKKAHGTPEARKANSKRTLQYHKDHPEQAEQHSIFMKNLFNNDPTRAERVSALQQNEDYDAGEWRGWSDKRRLYLIPANRCIHLNPRFEGSVRHHIMSGVIINIPIDLHRSIWHSIKTGRNIKEINKLAFQFLIFDFNVIGD